MRPRSKISSAVILFTRTVVSLACAWSPVDAQFLPVEKTIRDVTPELSPAARCHEFEDPNGPNWRWLVLDTVTVGAKHADKRDARRLAVLVFASEPYYVFRTYWARTKADSIEVVTVIAFPGYTLAETREGLAGTAWLVSDHRGHDEVWRTRLRRIPCAQLPR